jgi:type I restriction enzyme R subunit
MSLNESHLEEATLEWFRELGYQTIHGPNIAPGEPGAERQTLGQAVLEGRLREALRRLNPDMPEESREEALRKITRISTPSLIQTNRAFHRLIRDGVPVEWRRPDGSIAYGLARAVDFSEVENNDWLVVNQFTVVEGRQNRRADVVVFLGNEHLKLTHPEAK